MYLLVLILCLLALLIYCWFPRYRYRNQFKDFQNHVYAHRGYYNDDFPENTIGAFARAVNHGYGIELDVQITKDHQVVVCHDYNLLRASGKDLEIDQHSYDELKQISLFNKDCHLPLFQEVLDVVNGKVPLIVEIKQKAFDCTTCVLVQKILDQYQGMYVVESFNPIAMNWYLKHQPALIRGQLSCDFYKNKNMNPLKQFFLTNCLGNCLSRPDFIAYEVNDRQKLAFQILKKFFRVKTVLWTVKNEKQYLNVKNQGDIIIFEKFNVNKNAQ